jgi:phosphate transport system substrate-binding protein
MKNIFPLALGLILAPSVASAGTVTVKGSDTMVILVQRWAEEFMKQQSGTRVQVTGGGSGTGIAALINGTTDIASSSRPIKDAEKDKLRTRYNTPPTQIAVAKDGVAFYVHAENPIAALTEEQLRGIYLGDVTNWKELGGPDQRIIVYSRENSSGTYVFVKDNLLSGGDFTPAAQTLPGTAAVVNAVAKEKWGIGYGGAAYGKGIRELPIKVGSETVPPSAENVKSGKYPLARDLYFYTRQKPSGEIAQLVEFALSPAGQQIVTKVGYFPLE